MKQKASAKEVARLLLRFTVGEPPHRQVLMATLSSLDEVQRATIRDEIMFLDVVVILKLLQTDRVKQFWPTSEDILVEYVASLKESLEIVGGDSNPLINTLEARETAYREVLDKPLNVARFAVAETFASLCGFENNSPVVIAGAGEFVSAVNHVGELMMHYKITLIPETEGSHDSDRVRWLRKFRWPFKQGQALAWLCQVYQRPILKCRTQLT
jgi:hypothetical protein